MVIPTKNYFKKEIGLLDIYIYDDVAFDGLKAAGALAKQTLEHVAPFIQEGITTLELNNICHDFIIKNNAIPATLGYKGYQYSTCISLNNEVCHGLPSDKKLLTGDILNIDVTVILNGWYGDMSSMFSVGKVSTKAKNLMAITKQCLDEAIKIVKPNLKISEIGKCITNIAHKNHFSVVEEFCGHGIGHDFHLDPNVLHFYYPKQDLTLEKGMVFTIEPMINAGKKEVKLLKNGWTAVTKDFSLSAQYEHTIGITDTGCIIFTENYGNT